MRSPLQQTSPFFELNSRIEVEGSIEGCWWLYAAFVRTGTRLAFTQFTLHCEIRRLVMQVVARGHSTRIIGWLGSVVVGRRTGDREIVSSTPGRRIAG